jgi:HK97 family phage major capsid protein
MNPKKEELEILEDIKSSMESQSTEMEKFATGLKEANDLIENLKAKGEEVPEGLKDFMEKMESKLDNLETEIAEQKIQKRADEIEGSFKEAGISFMGFLKHAIAHPNQKTAITIYGAKEQATPDKEKALSTDIDPNGGYWLQPTFSGRIREFITESSPMRQLASIESVPEGTTEHMVPYEKDDKTGAGWVAERGSRSESATPEQALARIPLNEVYADPVMTKKIMNNPTFNTEAWLRRKVALKIARTENTAFVLGDAIDKPEGFLTNSTIEALITAASGVLDFDDLVDLQTALKDAYAPNGVFAFNRKVLRTIRKIKDNDGRYIWEPSGKNGTPGTLLGDPYVLMDDMPDTIAAGAKAVAYGDWKEGYTIVDGGGLSLIIDPYTRKGFIEFYWSKEVGGGVIQPDALKILTIKA